MCPVIWKQIAEGVKEGGGGGGGRGGDAMQADRKTEASESEGQRLFK